MEEFGTTKILPGAGLPAELSNLGRRALVREMTKNPMVTMTRALEFLCGDGRTFQVDIHLCSTPPIRLYGRVARRKTLLSKRNMTACLEFAKSHLKRLRP
jgi:hypothetical protein